MPNINPKFVNSNLGKINLNSSQNAKTSTANAKINSTSLQKLEVWDTFTLSSVNSSDASDNTSKKGEGDSNLSSANSSDASDNTSKKGDSANTKIGDAEDISSDYNNEEMAADETETLDDYLEAISSDDSGSGATGISSASTSGGKTNPFAQKNIK